MDISSLGATVALLYTKKIQRFEDPKILAPLKNVSTSSKIFATGQHLENYVMREQFDAELVETMKPSRIPTSK